MIDIKKFREDNNILQKEICEVLDIKQPYLSYIEAGKRPVSEKNFQKLYNHYGDVVLNYRRADVIIENRNNDVPFVVEGEHENNKGVPYYENLDVTGSVITSFQDYKENPTFLIDYPHFNDCDAYLPVMGNSMAPEYCSGEIIAVRKINNIEKITPGRDISNNYQPGS